MLTGYLTVYQRVDIKSQHKATGAFAQFENVSSLFPFFQLPPGVWNLLTLKNLYAQCIGELLTTFELSFTGFLQDSLSQKLKKKELCSVPERL